MAWPWVSRELYEESRKRVAALEEERRLMLNRLAEAAGARAFYPEVEEQGAGTREQGPAPRVAEPVRDNDSTDPTRTKATIDSVEAWANEHARKVARQRGVI